MDEWRYVNFEKICTISESYSDKDSNYRKWFQILDALEKLSETRLHVSVL